MSRGSLNLLEVSLQNRLAHLGVMAKQKEALTGAIPFLPGLGRKAFQKQKVKGSELK